MEKLINLNQKLGEIVSIFPDSSEIFNRHKIDYCCGGHDTLKEALEEKGLDSNKIIEELNNEYNKFINSNTEYKDWRKEKASDLIKHILRNHHDYTKKELREIDMLMFKILKVHFKHHKEELLKVHRLFGTLKMELEEHFVKEEEELFPLIIEFEETNKKELLEQIHNFIKDTENEHDDAGDILKEMEKVTRDFKAPEGACTTYKLVYDKLHNLEKDLFIHIYLENSVLFKMF
ncbi:MULTISPECIES: iron-sulfur cluster repair di-iron protein [Clostridium]|uniref:Iron-sulfur cluster repair protein YtfE n=2 Tax=Clostridium TaxID=1485 RepID=A0A151ALM0_9CLOT|nr:MULTISPECIES: iron-sulfur cluster repair di-iron protein [Clostridium]KYH28297.1 iron-sulfur cluster repair protein YtfE [Clostridium colicanis DSM 13634]MBE6043642.1 iron-sulfur cluster repair di-iron protein [Clostridium thermopalmarium]PRR74303.1 Iron-sulfur cluster repair protein YtfE [Clostridium thermopalmarium DSM 5974]PVZ22091.1 regulator of cell morphogenesis and NO signaling [Clostridium thermopalmarium DSM 5974]